VHLLALIVEEILFAAGFLVNRAPDLVREQDVGNFFTYFSML
jgi:hypothetical protein